MSLNDILGAAQSGLTAAQAALKTVSANVANVGTAGYARERVTLSTSVVQGRVTGVTVGEPARVADQFLEDAVYARAGDAGRAEAEATGLDRLQALFGQPGSPGGLPARIDALAASAVTMTGLPNAPQAMGAFVSDVADVIASLQQLSGDAQTIRADTESEIGHTVDRINTLIARIHDLNGEVSRLTGLGRSASGAADRRMSAIEELSGLVSVKVRHQPDGRVTIDSADGAVLLDRRPRRLDYAMTGSGTSQAAYPPITLRFADDAGNAGAPTGEMLSGPASGGTLGGLVALRDNLIPQFTDRLGLLLGGLAEALNGAANAAAAMPPPQSLWGRPSGLVSADRLGFAGRAEFAVTDATGTLIAATTLDFDALGPAATVNDAILAINAGLGGAATASIDAQGVVTFAATTPGTGVAIGQRTPPSDRAGSGFAQFFGLNDIVRSGGSALIAPGFIPADPHGFATGQTVSLLVRDANGRQVATATLAPLSGGTVNDLLVDLNASPAAQFGAFALDARGRFAFAPLAGFAGATLSIPSDSTDRLGTGRSFTALSGLTGEWAALGKAEVRKDLVGNPGRLPIAILQPGVTVGQKALGAGDVGGALALVDALGAVRDFAGRGEATLERYTSDLAGGIGSAAALAGDRLTDATARRTDAVNRRDSFSGVNLDEELAQMVVLQNSYGAAARVMTAAKDMYDTLIGMMR